MLYLTPSFKALFSPSFRGFSRRISLFVIQSETQWSEESQFTEIATSDYVLFAMTNYSFWVTFPRHVEGETRNIARTWCSHLFNHAIFRYRSRWRNRHSEARSAEESQNPSFRAKRSGAKNLMWKTPPLQCGRIEEVVFVQFAFNAKSEVRISPNRNFTKLNQNNNCNEL